MSPSEKATEAMCPRRLVAPILVVLAGFGAAGGSATAAVPAVDIGAPAGPLTHVVVGNELSCQAQHTGDTSFEFFPPTAAPGDCGTFLSVGGTLYSPNFPAHDRSAAGFGSTPHFTATSQTARTGAGTRSSPFRVVTTATAGGFTLTQTDTYIAGEESFRTDIAVKNTGGSAQAVILYRAGDCYLQNSDTGFGFAGANGAIGCSANANNTPPGRIEEFVPITGGANFLEGSFTDVWSAVISQMPFANLCGQCTTNRDNGAGISWSATINPNQTTTFSHFTTFSPTGRAGPPPSGSLPSGPTDLEASRVPNCLSVPSVARDVVARLPGGGSVVLVTRQVDDPARPLKLAIRVRGGGTLTSAALSVNGLPLQIAPGARPSAVVGVGSLLIGSRFQNRVVANVIVSNAARARMTQKMVILRCHVPTATCVRLGNGRRLRCTSRTPLGGRRVSVTVTRSAAETATGSATVTRGRYTTTVSSRTPLRAGVYAYKAVVRTGKRGERFQMIRRVTVR